MGNSLLVVRGINHKYIVVGDGELLYKASGYEAAIGKW